MCTIRLTWVVGGHAHHGLGDRVDAQFKSPTFPLGYGDDLLVSPGTNDITVAVLIKEDSAADIHEVGAVIGAGSVLPPAFDFAYIDRSGDLVIAVDGPNPLGEEVAGRLGRVGKDADFFIAAARIRLDERFGMIAPVATGEKG